MNATPTIGAILAEIPARVFGVFALLMLLGAQAAAQPDAAAHFAMLYGNGEAAEMVRTADGSLR